MKQKNLPTSISNKIEESLLATHLSDEADLEYFCCEGKLQNILDLVDTVMERDNLHTKGAEKLKVDITNLINNGKAHRQSFNKIGEQVLFLVWNSRLSGAGLSVIK